MFKRSFAQGFELSFKTQPVFESKSLNEKKLNFDTLTYLNEIKDNLELQPNSIKAVFENEIDQILNVVSKSIIINNKVFILSKNCNGKVFALVKDNESKKYKMVFFRESGSDHQWKSLPGYRKSGEVSKGEESNPMHHYVQSAKIHPKIYEALDSNVSIDLDISGLIPNEGGNFSEENTYSENYYSFKNDKLKTDFEVLQKLYKIYKILYRITDSVNRYNLEEDINQVLLKLSFSEERNSRINEIINNPKIRTFLDDNKNFQLYELNIKSIKYRNSNLDKDLIDLLAELENILYQEIIYPNTLELVKHSDITFEPDFQKNPINIYKKGDINIEEYEINTSEGDNLIFAMAHDSIGRVYVDNIYLKNSDITEYGTYSELINAGFLVYKPEDYKVQTNHIPAIYKNEVSNKGHYVDIADLFSLNPIINKYREHLTEKGVFVRPLKKTN